MASRKDMRRAELAVPYVEPAAQKSETDMGATMSSTLPMAAIFTRNKMIGWTSVIFAIQAWLSETPESAKTASTPAYLSIGIALLSVAVGYVPLFMPPAASRLGRGSGTEAPQAVPPQ